MKVCFLCANFPPEVHAGTELVVVALGRELQRAGAEVAVICTSDLVHAGRDRSDEEYAGMRVRRLFKKVDEWDGGGLLRPRLLAAVGELLAQERATLLHAHALASFGGGQLQQARALGIPSVLTLHDLWVTCARYFRLPPAGIVCPTGAGRDSCVRCLNLELANPDLRAVEQALAGRDREIRAEVAAAAVLTAPSRTAARMVQEHLPWPGAIEVIPHGLLRAVPAAARAAAPRPGERLRIGTFGNLVAEKGVLELVHAVAGIDCELHLAGRFLTPAFEQQVRATAARLHVALHCHGPFGPDDPHPAARLHLAVFPSRCQETYGLVVDEALAHGVPVVVSDHGALAERRATPGATVCALPSLPAVLHDLAGDRGALAAQRAAIAPLPTIERAAARYRELYEQALARRAVR